MSTKEEIEASPNWEVSPGFSNVITASGGDGYGYYYYYHHKPTKKPTNYFAPIPNLLSEVYTRIRQKHQAQQADQETKASVYHVLSETKRILGEKQV